MSENSRLSVFISWSGKRSGAIAKVFSEWLADGFQFTEPFLSKDIGAGERWSTVLAEALDNSYFGIIILTRENLHSDWILFEAGALAKHLGKSRVIPCLVDVEPSDVMLPLNAFQCVRLPSELKKVLTALNDAQPDPWDGSKVDRLFSKFEPLFRVDFEKALAEHPTALPDKGQPSNTELMLQEVLQIVRSTKPIPGDPEEVIPENYQFYPVNDRVSLYNFLKQQDLVRSYKNASMPALFQAAAKYVSALDSSLDEDSSLNIVARYLVSDRPLKSLLDGLKEQKNNKC
jgi:TIR domain